MTYIISPSSNGWGCWQEHLEKGKVKIKSEIQRSLLAEVMSKNVYKGDVGEVCFDILNPCTSGCPAEYFYRGLCDNYETLHPLIVLAACVAWEGMVPADNSNLVSPHLLADEDGKNYILLLEPRGEDGNILSFIPVDQWVWRPGYFVGISPSSYQYQHYRYAEYSKRITL